MRWPPLDQNSVERLNLQRQLGQRRHIKGPIVSAFGKVGKAMQVNRPETLGQLDFRNQWEKQVAVVFDIESPQMPTCNAALGLIQKFPGCDADLDRLAQPAVRWHHAGATKEFRSEEASDNGYRQATGYVEPHPQGREARRPAGAGADQIRDGDEPQDGQKPRPHSDAFATRPPTRWSNRRRLLSRVWSRWHIGTFASSAAIRSLSE